MSEPLRRPDWDEYFLGIAGAVSRRADCRRRRFGAVIVDTHHRVVATGYNGSAPGEVSCMKGACPRGISNSESYVNGNMDFTDCIALHAEQNAIANADPQRCSGGTIYIGQPNGDGLFPCDMCRKLIQAAGITRVVWSCS